MEKLEIILKYFPVHFIVVFTLLALTANALIRNPKGRLIVHTITGFAFVSIFGGLTFAEIVLAEILVIYGIAKLQNIITRKWLKIVLTVTGIIIPLVLLAAAKYTYTSGFAEIPGVIYAIGISYFTFKLIHIVVDTYRGLITNVSLINIASLVFFFPTFTAGPIERYNHFSDNAAEKRSLDREDIETGIKRIIYGLFKKFIIADKLYFLITEAKLPEMEDGFMLMMYLYLLSFKIYYDFSGYTDIAVGLSRLFGLKMPENFNRPYLKRNIVMFWQSWHMTLTGWLRDYVFLPVAKGLVFLTGSSLSLANNAVTQLITMALVGIWHGTTLNFLIWGLYHGIGLSLYRVYATQSRRFIHPKILDWMDKSRTCHALSIFLTFNYVTIGWIFFTYDVTISWEMLCRIF